MFKGIIGMVSLFWVYLCIVSALNDNLSVAIIAAMFANIFYISFFFIEDDEDDDSFLI